nr:casparian strip membrane protein 2-like [Ipomoea batatas]
MKADGATEGSGGEAASRGARGISIMDLILRVVAIVGSLGSAVAMGTTDQTLPFIIQSFRFEAQYDDFDTFKLFVIVSAIVCGYLALTLPLSIFHILRTRAEKSRILLIFLDTEEGSDMVRGFPGLEKKDNAATTRARIMCTSTVARRETNAPQRCVDPPFLARSVTSDSQGRYGHSLFLAEKESPQKSRKLLLSISVPKSPLPWSI